jgi:predicted  nucleic acid-binding Zn-ribbon protein
MSDIARTTCEKCGERYTVDHAGCPQCAINKYRATIQTLRSEIEGLRKENAEHAESVQAFEAEVVRLANCLHAIHKAAPEVPASVLRGIAYDIVLNGIGPDVAEYQIERRAKSLLSTPNGPG